MDLKKEFPFLKNIISVSDGEVYFDEAPVGWSKLLLEMSKEIKQHLINNDFLNNYYVFQVKEKYGRLCWYDNCSIVDDIVSKYEEKICDICIVCGGSHVTRQVSRCSVCEDCYNKYFKRDY